MEISVTVPTEAVGDILSDMSGQRRGHVQDQTQEGAFTTLRTHAPLAEVQTYSQTLQSVTGGEGFFTMSFSHYRPRPRPDRPAGDRQVQKGRRRSGLNSRTVIRVQPTGEDCGQTRRAPGASLAWRNT